jgi:hypothetical protein
MHNIRLVVINDIINIQLESFEAYQVVIFSLCIPAYLVSKNASIYKS